MMQELEIMETNPKFTSSSSHFTPDHVFLYLYFTPSIFLSFVSLQKITPNYSASIQLVELHLPDTPELPSHHHTTNGLPPHLNSTLQRTLNRAKPDLSNVLETIKPDLVIYDVFQSWTAALTATHNIPAVIFTIASVTNIAYFCHSFVKPGLEFPFPAIYLSDFEEAKAQIAAEDARANVNENDPASERPNRFCDSIMLVRSSREIDGKYMDYLSDIRNLKIMPVGTLFPEPADDDQDDKNTELIQWLGTKSKHSTVFIAFGSEYFLTKEEMEEMAFALELSGVNFIWAVRFPQGQRIKPEKALPEEFLERTGDRGRIVEGWAPQAKILGHPSIGGFISHSGWSSILESMVLGVPIINMPMHSDQPFNARLVVEIGAGVEVVRDTNGKFDRKVIAEVIKNVVVEKMGGNLRGKIREVSEKIKLKENQEFDEAVDMLTELVMKNNHPSN
ncbi:beta-D-glucosyl crocetin beta-1,6-glucosyltransferase-like [Coffea arabica]|uniref:Glycosyltransferase n=1 Tax=Coffea arabica TaxID=13443 RepID=A0A6P6TVL7_COFAR|nr:beta-D-glucosyl crocetin beta-1,6-glucosyltransferase-like [Coffea arabica]